MSIIRSRQCCACLVLLYIALAATGVSASASEPSADMNDLKKVFSRASSLWPWKSGGGLKFGTPKHSTQRGSGVAPGGRGSRSKRAGPGDDLTCTGKITAVFCNETSDGDISQIAYFNSALSGIQFLGCSSAVNWTGPADKTLLLNANESITAVQTCNNKHGGAFESITFLTNKGQSLTCGTPKGHDSYNDDSYGGYGDYRSHPYTAHKSANDSAVSIAGLVAGGRSSSSSRISTAAGGSLRNTAKNNRKLAPHDLKKNKQSSLGVGNSTAKEVPSIKEVQDSPYSRSEDDRYHDGPPSHYGGDREEDEGEEDEHEGPYGRHPQHHGGHESDDEAEEHRPPYYRGHDDNNHGHDDNDEYPPHYGGDDEYPDEHHNDGDGDGDYGHHHHHHVPVELECRVFYAGIPNKACPKPLESPYGGYNEAYPGDNAAYGGANGYGPYSVGGGNTSDPIPDTTTLPLSLASFNVECGKDDSKDYSYSHFKRKEVNCANDFCWNNATVPPACLNASCLPSVIVVVLPEETPCPNTPEQFQSLLDQLALISANVAAAPGSPIQEIIWDVAPLECEALGGANTTLTITATFVAKDGSTQQNINEFLEQNLNDLCVVNSNTACDGTDIISIPVETPGPRQAAPATADGQGSELRKLLSSMTLLNLDKRAQLKQQHQQPHKVAAAAPSPAAAVALSQQAAR